jgi:transcriptional regulator
MYVPPLYRPADLATQHDLIEGHRFGQLTTLVGSRMDAVHIPFVLDREEGPRGRLRAHLARANPIVASLRASAEVLVSFVGPNSYMCPDDYATDGHFPTWNYGAVHVHGRPRMLDTSGELAQLADLIASEENRRLPKRPWTLDRMPEEVIAEYQTHIVAFELPIDRIEGIVKYGQNKVTLDVETQIGALSRRRDTAMAAVIEQLEIHNAKALAELRASAANVPTERTANERH